MSTPKALLKKEVRRGLRGGGLSKKEYILSSKAESEDNFSLIWRRQIKGLNIEVKWCHYLWYIAGNNLTGNIGKLEPQPLLKFLWGLLQDQVQQLGQDLLLGQEVNQFLVLTFALLYYVLLLKDLCQCDRLLVQQRVNVADGEGVVLPEHGDVDRGLRQGPGLQQHSKVKCDRKLVEMANQRPVHCVKLDWMHWVEERSCTSTDCRLSRARRPVQKVLVYF